MNRARRCALETFIILAAVTAAPVVAQDAGALRTAPERTNYRETTRYAEVMAFVERVAAASPVIVMDTFGYTHEGRALPLAIVSSLPDPSPEAVRASGSARPSCV